MVVQRLDHDSDPVLNEWIIFHTAAPCQFRAISVKSKD
jgi:hypothetical protein